MAMTYAPKPGSESRSGTSSRRRTRSGGKPAHTGAVKPGQSGAYAQQACGSIFWAHRKRNAPASPQMAARKLRNSTRRRSE